MSIPTDTKQSRRAFLATGAVFLATPALSQSQSATYAAPFANSTEVERDPTESTRRNVSSFRALDWEPYFNNTVNGAILVDIDSRALHYWSEDRSIYKLYPTSVPVTDDLTRRGSTSVTRKVENPSWAPTPAMKVRNPEWPEFVGPGPDNPLGTRALYLSWTYYRIHGTHDTRKIGRRSSNGCIGLYNEHIEELYELAKVGTQVLLI
ncbi:L,D-transpeptidase [Pseudooceanicola spongiae]|jgi:L,D-transpeptidase ErfK/SrfK|uniref:L,D-transpeptidase family protein n=1 Tax=Pseudooceanicola spongiae TaxID=2613965 RepID=A0A7L9WRJ6_9RHOB|nr:L,D-transpeptidase [Pseudooceanicola spongiae]QOL82066.1 L,D-transpeptidase family protein [Pseudooceanicola spongiae]|tara:strand:+ start:1262 stop:1882 length:621 start_codon:yes stop_codon:yes gene_type:complete